MDLTSPRDPDPPAAGSITGRRVTRAEPELRRADPHRARGPARSLSPKVHPDGGGDGAVRVTGVTGGEITPELASALIERIFGCGLLLSGVSSTIGQDQAGDRLAFAAAELDRLISQIRGAVINHPSLLGTRPGLEPR